MFLTCPYPVWEQFSSSHEGKLGTTRDERIIFSAHHRVSVWLSGYWRTLPVFSPDLLQHVWAVGIITTSRDSTLEDRGKVLYPGQHMFHITFGLCGLNVSITIYRSCWCVLSSPPLALPLLTLNGIFTKFSAVFSVERPVQFIVSCLYLLFLWLTWTQSHFLSLSKWPM